MTEHTDLVYGERRTDLLTPLRAVLETADEGPDGMVHYEAKFDMSVGAPLFRALMRAEAELLQEDADRLGLPGYEDRSPSQRRNDAFFRMVTAFAAN